MPNSHGSSNAGVSVRKSMSFDGEGGCAGLDHQQFGTDGCAVGKAQALRRRVVLDAAAQVDDQEITGMQRGGGRQRVSIRFEVNVVRIQVIRGAIAKVVLIADDE